jgi:aminoglycoside phosphotransferase (APT) family kinase protein
MYCYQKVNGEVLSGVISLPLFKRFLEHCQSFWLKVGLTNDQATKFADTCRKFYHDKTRERVELFYRNFDKQDGTERINDETMPLLSSLLDQVDWDDLAKGLPGQFHGDFHFENILWNPQSETFTFLDWRQDFGGDLEVGDIYYDLAKLLHGLIVSHELIAKDAFSVVWGKDSIQFDLHRKQVLVECEQYFMVWCDKNGFDSTKVRLLTALIYLNIAALHHHPYSLLLYALGKSMLNHQREKK